MNLIKIKKLRQEVIISFLWGMFSFTKFKPFYCQIEFFKFPIITFYNYKSCNRHYKGIRLLSKNKINKYVEEDCLFHITKQAPSKYKNIIFIRTGLGEAYLLNIYLKQILESFNLTIENTCFVGLRDTFGELFCQYNSEVNYKKINLSWDYLVFGIDKREYHYGQKNIYFYIEKEFIYKKMNDYKNNINTNHYVTEICNHFNIQYNSFKKEKYLPTSLQRANAIKRLQEENININNFIFISKTALSIDGFSNAFWNDLEHFLKLKGYDIYYNSNKLSITEAKVIASYSKAIIALRSGFLETISELDNVFYVLYSKLSMNDASAKLLKNIYSLKYYPNFNKENFFEFDNETMTEEQILEAILGGL